MGQCSLLHEDLRGGKRNINHPISSPLLRDNSFSLQVAPVVRNSNFKVEVLIVLMCGLERGWAQTLHTGHLGSNPSNIQSYEHWQCRDPKQHNCHFVTCYCLWDTIFVFSRGDQKMILKCRLKEMVYVKCEFATGFFYSTHLSGFYWIHLFNVNITGKK